MAQFTLTWDNSEVLLSTTSALQRASYRQRGSIGGWLTDGFTPPNDFDKSVNQVLTKVLAANVVWQFMIQNICFSGTFSANDNGIVELIGFSCLEPIIDSSETTSTATLDLTGTDITKVSFQLRKASDNSLVYGPTTINRVGNICQAVATGLVGSTGYYWQTVLFAVINGVEVNSAVSTQLNGMCGPFVTTTDAVAPYTPDLAWVPDTVACEKDGGLNSLSEITGLSSPMKTFFDKITGRMYVADLDDTNGNVYWFDPNTATSAADMTHSTAISGTFYTAEFDVEKRRIYFVGLTDNGNGVLNDGIIIYDIATDTRIKVAFGTAQQFARTTLFVGKTNIVTADAGNSNLYLINRDTLAITTKAFSAIPNGSRFLKPIVLVQPDTSIYAISNGSNPGSIGVYDETFTTNTEIVLPGIVTWSFSYYWQTAYYDSVVNLLYISDIGSNQIFSIDPDTNTIVSSAIIGNRQGKTNVACFWTTNPVTGDLYRTFQAMNSSSDTAPIKRTYLISRSSFDLREVMYENKYFTRLTLIEGTTKVIGADTGLTVWYGGTAWITDGTLTILSAGAGTSNTGNQLTLTLKQIDHNNSDLPTGLTKPNLPSDSDYIAPIKDLADCPITVSLDCPADSVTTFLGTTLEYEFSLASSVVANTNIAKIQVFAYNINTASIEGLPNEYTLSKQYFSGVFTGLGGLNYTIKIKYLNSIGLELQNC